MFNVGEYIDTVGEHIFTVGKYRLCLISRRLACGLLADCIRRLAVLPAMSPPAFPCRAVRRAGNIL